MKVWHQGLQGQQEWMSSCSGPSAGCLEASSFQVRPQRARANSQAWKKDILKQWPGLPCKHPREPQTSWKPGRKAQQTFSVKSQVASISGFMSYVLCYNYSMLSLQCKNSPRQANKCARLYSDKTLQKQLAGWVWFLSSSLLTTGL